MFSRRTGQDRAAPHHFANYWVTKNLGRAVFNSGAPVKDAAEWRSVPAGQLRREARHLLLDSSVHLQNVGATTVERFLS
jgi:hypothetical protein